MPACRLLRDHRCLRVQCAFCTATHRDAVSRNAKAGRRGSALARRTESSRSMKAMSRNRPARDRPQQRRHCGRCRSTSAESFGMALHGTLPPSVLGRTDTFSTRWPLSSFVRQSISLHPIHNACHRRAETSTRCIYDVQVSVWQFSMRISRMSQADAETRWAYPEERCGNQSKAALRARAGFRPPSSQPVQCRCGSGS